MIYSVDFAELSEKISHINVAKYLLDLGWTEIASRREKVKIFQLERNEAFYQVDVPGSRELRDYKTAMFRTIETIARSESKSVEQTILELLNPLSDILRLRVSEPKIDSGSILVEDAIKLYDNAKKLLIATAMDVMSPQLFHAGRPDSNVLSFISNCRFGQTEIGSYVVSIVCPLAKIESNQIVQLSLFNEEEECAQSLTRKVINKLISSVKTVRDSISNGTLDSMIHANANTEDCISANFLDALSGINIHRIDSTLDITAKYAPTIRANTLPDARVSINHDFYTPIDTMVKSIKGIQESEKTYFGMIKALDAAPDLSKREKGKVTIVFLNEAQNKVTATTVLAKDDYAAAIAAHQEGRTIKVSGLLSGGRTKKLDCTYFEVLQ